LDVQRALLFMQESQGPHMTMSGGVVDSVGSSLRKRMACCMELYVFSAVLVSIMYKFTI